MAEVRYSSERVNMKKEEPGLQVLRRRDIAK